MKFKVGDCWKTRDGRKAKCLDTELCTNGAHRVAWTDTSHLWSTDPDGQKQMWKNLCDDDILEPWREKFDREMWAHINPNGDVDGYNKHDERSCADSISPGWRCIKVRVTEIEGSDA